MNRYERFKEFIISPADPITLTMWAIMIILMIAWLIKGV
jgi:hypothetical protein